MLTSITLDPSYSLAPREIKLLKRFANPDTLKIREFRNNAYIFSEVGQASIAAAILANEAVGNIRLEVRKGSRFFGLFKFKNLYANPTTNPIEWPKYSLEAEIPQSAEYYKPLNDSHTVVHLITTWIGTEFEFPWQKVNDKILFGLFARGCLEKQEEIKRKFFKEISMVRYVLHHKTASLLSQQSIQPINQILNNCRFYRCEV